MPDGSQEPSDKTADPRYLRSLDALLSAIITLAEVDKIPTISITQVTTEAGVSRPTFYQHATDVPDLARKAAIGRLRQALPPPPDFTMDGSLTRDLVKKRVSERVVPILTHLSEHRPFYVNVLENAASPALFSSIVEMLTARFDRRIFSQMTLSAGITPDDLSEVLMGGFMWKVVRWLTEDNSGSTPGQIGHDIAEMAAMLLVPNEPRSA